jgi:hypothetical protein
MTQEIQKSNWKTFFEKLSKEKFGWETTIQILSEETGANMLSEGAPFDGITYEDNQEGSSVEVITGTKAGDHDSHTISDPQKVAFQPNKSGEGGTLDIEDVSGAKTLISFIGKGQHSDEEQKTGTASGH